MSWLYDASVSAAEQQRRQKLRVGFLAIAEAMRDDSILKFSAGVDIVGNNMNDDRPVDSKAFDVVTDPPATPSEEPNVRSNDNDFGAVGA